jgi:drug/metabolite transporter (DMT)-like permease
MKYKGEIGLLAVAIIWGSGFVASDIAVGFFTAYQVLALRFGLSAVCLGLAFPGRLGRISRFSWQSGLMVGVFLYLAFLFQTVGLVYTTPARNAFLTAVNVIIVPYIGLLLYRRPIDRYGTAGAFIAAAGVGLISLNLDLSVNIGDLLTLVCAIGFAFHIFFTGEQLRRGAHAIDLTIAQMVVAAGLGGIVATITTLAGIGDAKGGATWQQSLGAVVYLAVFSTTLAFLLQTVSQKTTPATRAAVIMCTESVFGALFSALLLKERLSVRTIIGATLVFAAVLIAEAKPGQQPTAQADSVAAPE